MRAVCDADCPRTADVRIANPTSASSLTIVAISVAATSPPKWDGISKIVACAASPLAAPVIKRVLVYVAHFSLGARSGPPRDSNSGSPSIDADPTTPAASGPNRTAANTAGMPEIDNSSVWDNRTLTRSVTAPAVASASTVNGASSVYPANIRMQPVPSAAMTRTAT